MCCDLLVMAQDTRIGYMPTRVWGCPSSTWNELGVSPVASGNASPTSRRRRATIGQPTFLGMRLPRAVEWLMMARQFRPTQADAQARYSR